MAFITIQIFCGAFIGHSCPNFLYLPLQLMAVT